MISISPCYRENLCVDCDSKTCLKAGDPEADCPVWKCLYPDKECKGCELLKGYVDKWRREHGTKWRMEHGTD